MQEEWIDIVGFEGIYYISSLGRVKKVNKIIACSPNKNRHGYCYSNLQHGNKRKNALVHRLVALHFIPNPLNKRCVNHINFEVSDNKVSNLEWATHKENSAHTVKAGRAARTLGEKCGNAVLTLDTVRAIRKELAAGVLSYKKIAEKFGTNYSNVAHISRGSRWQYCL